MTTIIRVLLVALALVISNANAQSFQGIATYKTKRNIDIKMDSTQINSDMQKKMMEMMKKQFEKTYTLTFNKEESIYRQEESLDKPQVGGDGFQVKILGAGGTDILYKNTKENNYSDQKDTMGKIFLVKDDIEKIDWELESETKYIGEYQCYKATFTKQVEVSEINFRSYSKKDRNIEEEKEEPKMEERTVTAWYTPQIPVNNGPAKYQGLPGLILEVHDGKLHIVCSRIVINPKDKVEIEEPTKGKVVSQEEYDNIMDKKAKEMMERFSPRKNGRQGEGMEIRIGG